MTPANATRLINTARISKAVPQQWADLGCGDGLFSNALLHLLPAGSTVYAIDKQPAAFNLPGIRFMQMDFVKDNLPLPPLHGILMANALHFVNNQFQWLQNIGRLLLPGGLIIIVEYNTDNPNQWVPYPLSFTSAASLFSQAGFDDFEKISEQPSKYQKAGIYVAVAARDRNRL